MLESSQENTNKILTGLDDQSSEATARRPALFSRTLFYLFIAALAIRIWFNFFTNHVNAYGVSDASEYLRYATAISKLNWTTMNFGPEWKEFAISGPSFPVFLLLCSLVSFAPFDATRFDIFLNGQSLISAATVVFIAYIGKRLWNETTGYWAGILAAIYPGFIVNSGRLYSETFATFLECAASIILVKFICQKKTSIPTLALMGALLVLLQLTRSSMILFSISVIAIVFLSNFRGKNTNWNQSISASFAVILGMLAILIPWFIFQKTAFNKITPVVDRVGHYNLFIGTNTDTQGFLTYPYPDGRGIESKSYTQLVREAYKKSPSRALRLALDKPARLYKFPWNDFRATIGPITFPAQVLVHQLIILLSLCGFCLSSTLFNTNVEKDEQGRLLWARYALLLLVLLNLPYLAFITVPRYNLTAMPAIILFAAAGLTALIALLKSQPLQRAPKVAALSAIFLFVYLRDDLKTPFLFNGAETATIYSVQGAEPMMRSLIAAIGTMVFFGALLYSTRLLNGFQKTARVLIALFCSASLVLCIVPQRANGRQGENIVTLARPGEKLSGKIMVPKDKLKDKSCSWFILIDSDKGELIKNQFTLSVGGKKVFAAPIPALSALDNWDYLKTNGSNYYVECSYIFDCLSSAAGISNSELRQWFALPLSSAQLEQIADSGFVDVTIEQKSETPSSFFCAAPSKGKEARIEQLLPARLLYSWEKSFYGVENDAGFTDTRLDEKVPGRSGKWAIAYKNNREELKGMDVNVRLIKVQARKSTQKNGNLSHVIQGQDQGNALINIPEQLSNAEQQLLTVELVSKNKLTDGVTFTAQNAVSPELYLTWKNRAGIEEQMPLPGLLRGVAKNQNQSVSFLVDLKKTNGSNHQLHCRADKDCLVRLQAMALPCHPFYSPQELF